MKPLTPRHLYRVFLEDEQIIWLDARDLPEDWMLYPHPESTQALGDAWVEAGKTVALAVPSVLAPQEHNFVLNRTHPDFTKLKIEGPEAFPINPRLMPDAAQ
jgi:RES domain-containing protein